MYINNKSSAIMLIRIKALLMIYAMAFMPCLLAALLINIGYLLFFSWWNDSNSSILLDWSDIFIIPLFFSILAVLFSWNNLGKNKE